MVVNYYNACWSLIVHFDSFPSCFSIFSTVSCHVCVSPHMDEADVLSHVASIGLRSLCFSFPVTVPLSGIRIVQMLRLLLLWCSTIQKIKPDFAGITSINYTLDWGLCKGSVMPVDRLQTNSSLDLQSCHILCHSLPSRNANSSMASIALSAEAQKKQTSTYILYCNNHPFPTDPGSVWPCGTHLNLFFVKFFSFLAGRTPRHL